MSPWLVGSAVFGSVLLFGRKPGTVATSHAPIAVPRVAPPVIWGAALAMDPSLRAKPLRADSPLPGVLPTLAPEDIPARMALAARLASHLYTTPLGAEDKALVARFQACEGLRASGYYGPSAAVRLGEIGIVPPPPRYWPRTDTKRSKQTYVARMLQFAARDPQRAEEWQQATRGL